MFNIGDKVYHYRINSYKDLEIIDIDGIEIYCKGKEYISNSRIEESKWSNFVKRKFFIFELRNKEFNNNINYKKESKWNKIIFRQLNMGTSLEYLYRQYKTGELDLNPFYQRDLVWTEEQKRSYIENLFLEKAQITPTLILNFSKEYIGAFEVLDGKQRLSTLFDFIENKISIFDNVYFEELSSSDIKFLLSYIVKYTRISKQDCTDLTNKEKIELFIEINELGTKMSDEHINRIKKLLY